MTPLSRLRSGATATCIVLAAIGGIAAVSFPNARMFFGGLSVAALLELPGYWALSLTLRSSNSRFFGAFVGGMLGRMLVLGALVGYLWREESRAVIPFVLGAVLGLVGFSFVELHFIGRQNRLPH